MKLLPLCLAFGLVAPVCAQAPVGSRALSRADVLRQSWPMFSAQDEGYADIQVRGLQFLLRNSGFSKSRPDGAFGSATERAVKRFQRAQGLKADGIVGAQTWAKLCPRLKRGDRGDAVRALQTLLAVKADGSFGYGTETALRKLQKNLGLKSDGVVGAQIWAALLSSDGGGD